MVSPNIKYNSSSHYCLKYAKVFYSRECITASDIHSMFSHKLDRISKIERSLEMLGRYGMMRRAKHGWKITERGISHLHSMAKKTALSDE